MTWLKLAENPEAIDSVFEAAPSLNNVEIVHIVVDRDGPTVEIAAALEETPTRLSHRLGKTGANAVTLRLQLLGVQSLSLNGWSSENRAKIEIQPGISAKIDMSIIGANTNLSCKCTWLRIAGLTPYHREPMP